MCFEKKIVFLDFREVEVYMRFSKREGGYENKVLKIEIENES